MTQDGSPEHQKPPAGREGPGKQIRRVSQRKELAVVTLGMVAAISGVGGLLAANPPSWATNTQPDHKMVAQKTTANHESIQRAAEQAARRTVEQAAVRPAPQKNAGREEEARKAAVSAQSARSKARRAARRQQAVYSAQPQGSASASASATPSTASPSAMSRGS